MSTILWVPVVAGAVIALTGLVLLVLVFQKLSLKEKSVPGHGWPDVVMKLVELLDKWTPVQYRIPIILILVGGALMVVPLVATQ